MNFKHGDWIIAETPYWSKNIWPAEIGKFIEYLSKTTYYETPAAAIMILGGEVFFHGTQKPYRAVRYISELRLATESEILEFVLTNGYNANLIPRY